MAEIDPVIVQLRADVAAYRNEMRSTANLVDASLTRQERAVASLEAKLRSSSASMSNSLRSLAGSFATYLSGRELIALSDNFTRLQNSLRVAGLEGAGLEQVQARLLALSQKYGVSINELANLFGKVTQSSTELGIGQAETLKLTEATSQALLITGTSAAQAQGALLGLSQALASGTVRAEEFNQINEGGLLPLLQAAAASDRFGGSVAKLRAAVLDGKVSSQEFLASLLANTSVLEGPASKATLTLAGGFQALQSSLTVYIGEADRANGVSAALGQAMKSLADNLYILIPAISAVAVGFGVNFVGNAVRARVAAASLSVATAGVTASMGAATVTASGAGKALLAAFGGPAGVLILAVGAAVALYSANAERAARGNEAVRETSERVARNSEATRSAIDRLATSYGKAKDEALQLALAQRRLAAIDVAKTGRQALEANLSLNDFQRRIASGEFGGGRGLSAAGELLAAERASANAAARNFRNAQGNLSAIDSAISQANAPRVATGTSPSGTGSKPSRGAGNSGPSPQDIEGRFQSQLTSLQQQALSARQALATSAEEQARLSLDSVELSRKQALDEVANEKSYSAAQRERLNLQIEALASAEIQAIQRDKSVRLEQEQSALADAAYDAQREFLQGQYDLAENQAERRRIALELVDIEYEHRKAALEALIASQTTTDAEKQRAQIALSALGDARNASTSSAVRQTEGPAQQFIREISKSSAQINEDLESIAVSGLKNLNNDIADVILGAKSLGDAFGDVANQIISDLLRIAVQQAIIKPLSESLFPGGGGFGASGGGGGFLGGIGSIFSSIFGRASGGYVAPGQTVRVNEHAGGAEFLRMGTQGGTVIPLGQINQQVASRGQAGVQTVRIMVEEAPGFATRVADISAGVAVEVHRVNRKSLVDEAVTTTLNRATRVRL